MRTTYTDAAYLSFKEETKDALTDKEGYAVLLGAAENTVKLATDAAEAEDAIGVVFEKYGNGNTEVTVRAFGKGGTFRGVAGGVISKGDLVAVDDSSRFVSTVDKDLAVGRYIGQATTAIGDIIEILD